MELVKVVNGWPIYYQPFSRSGKPEKRPYSTFREVGGFMGTIDWGFETLEAAEKFAKNEKR